MRPADLKLIEAMIEGAHNVGRDRASDFLRRLPPGYDESVIYRAMVAAVSAGVDSLLPLNDQMLRLLGDSMERGFSERMDEWLAEPK